MTRSTTNLLRRTLVILGAAVGFATATETVAQGTVTLSSGGSCTYSAMTIQPNGNVAVTCSGSGGTPNPAGRAFFTLTAPSSIAANTVYNAGQFKVSRTDTSGPAENVAFGYSVTGSGCTYASSGPFWLSPPGGSKPSENLTVSTAASGSCTITLTVQEGHSGSNPLTMSIGTTNPNPNPTPGPIAGCDAPATNSMDRSGNIGILYRDGGGSSVDQLRMDSGTIAYYKVVAAPKPEQSVLVMFTQGQQPNSPASMVTEFSVSKCPGVIKTDVPQCYYRSTAINANAMSIFTAPVAQYGWTSQEAIGDRGCYAPVAERDYYVNVRWTFPTCVWGAGNCGTSMQWAPTGSNF